MDLYDEGFFIHMFGSFKSANLIFEIPSVYGRGNRELLMLSIVIDISSSINFDLLKELLVSFETEFKKIYEVYKAFYINSIQFEGDKEKLEEIRHLFFTFYQTFPKESIIYDRKDAKILVFGLFQAGKTTIINFLKKTITPSARATTHIDISRILVNNLSLYIYDTPGQIKYRSLWEPYLKNQEGLVFVLDTADTEKYEYARETLHEVAMMAELERLPLLILLNKIDLMKPNVEKLNKEMDIEKMGNRFVKSYPTCGLTGKNIDDAFEWLTEKILKRFYPTPKRELGIIFSRWDETIGAEIIGTHPNDLFEDPEIIAIRCFSLSQYIFGGEDFKRISVILPLTHLKVKAAIYFDYVHDEKVRGGRLPLSIMVFYNDSIPRVIIDQFNLYIFERFEKIKEVYTNQIKIIEELKEIHNTISNKLKSFEPTIQAARIAEMRYQALFKAARDAILIIDRKSGIIVDANEQTEKLLQRPLEDIIGLHANQIKIENNQNFGERILTHIELEDLPPMEIGLSNQQNEITPVEVNASEIQMGGQNLIQCILRDITKRKLAVKQLKESEKKYKYLFKNSPFSIFLIDCNGIIIDCNPSVEQLLGYKRAKLIDKQLMDEKLSIIDPKYILLLVESLKKVVKGETLTFLDIKLKKQNGEFIWANIHTSLVKLGKESFIQIIANDITFQKEADLERKRVLQALQTSEAKFHDAYDEANFYKEIFTHDIRELFDRIELSVELITEFQNRDYHKDDINDILKRLKTQTCEGNKIITKVRKLSEIEDSINFIEPVDALRVLKNAIDSISNEFKDKDIKIEINSTRDDYIVRANKFLFDVYENILINTIKYNENPQIKIEIKISDEIQKNVSYVKMQFIDNTIGMLEKKGETIIQHDVVREINVRGILLGLILVDRIINSYNGQVWVEDKVIGEFSQRSNFIVLIPSA